MECVGEEPERRKDFCLQREIRERGHNDGCKEIITLIAFMTFTE